MARSKSRLIKLILTLCKHGRRIALFRSWFSADGADEMNRVEFAIDRFVINGSRFAVKPRTADPIL